MNNRMRSGRSVPAILLALAALFFGSADAFATGSLQGQNKGDTNTWVSENVMGWQELDYIPCRVSFGSGSAGNQAVEIDFPFESGGTPGFENLFFFTCATTNATFVSGPTLTTSPTGNWAYNFTVNISDNNPAIVTFFARLAAGAHLNGGSSLHLTGSEGILQVHKPAPGPGEPDLAIVKTGPVTIPQGGTITYTLTYTNLASGTNTAVGVQASDALPPGVVVNPATLPANAQFVGTNGMFFIFWDLTNVAPGATGQFSFQAQVPYSTSVGTVLTNVAQIQSSQDDANPANNISTWLTTVTAGCAGIVVSTPPGNQAACPGSTAMFTVTASGAGLTYQWYNGTSVLNGQNANSLSLTNVNNADAGTYSVVISDPCGDSVTNSATLTVNSATLVSTPPANSINCPGTTVNFSVNATGTDLAYQWYQGTTLLAGQTGSTLTITNVTAAGAGLYNVVVTGACGAAVTNSASLTVNADTLVTVPPVNSTNCPGTTANFSVNAGGTALTYQWYQGTSLLAGQTASTLNLTNVSAASAGVYNVVISGACGTAVTNSAVLAVNANTLVTVPPVNSTNCPGTTANFSVNATGTALTYQWYQGATLLAGETASTLTLTNLSAASAGVYNVVIIGACGAAVTNSAVLVVNANTLVTVPPVNSTNCPGTTANFSVNATGTDLAYQWYQGTTLLAGQTANTLTLTNVSAASAGVYNVVITGACGTAVTNSAVLVVNANTLVTVPPVNSTNCPGTMANFSVNATGTALTYQWYQGATLLAGETASTLTLTNLSAASAGVYNVVITGACGAAVTNSAVLVVNANTLVTVPPVNSTNCPGTTANFSVNATGTALTYQWYQGATLLAGQTASTLTLTNLSAASAGVYNVVITGACGAAVTNSAVLVVNANSLVTVPPANATNCPGTTANFSVNATGTDLTYAWFKGSALFPGTNSSISITNVTAASAGVYTVVVTGACGTTVTNSATLVVNADTLVSEPPVNSTNCPGTTANFSVNATGTSLTYQWYQGTNALTGQTNSILTLTNVNAAEAGTYSVIIAGACGRSLTNSAILTVNANLLVSTSPADQVVCPGGTANFSVNATGTDLSYQWYQGTSLLAGQTASTLTLTNVSSAQAGVYAVVVAGACGSAMTNSATLTVNSDVLVTTPPANSTNCPGATANFSVNALGSGLAYQWYHGASLLSGQTAGTLTLTNMTAASAGSYSVVVSGACGGSVTNSATLVVNANTLVTIPPANSTNCPGTTANFSVNATGADLTYVWFKGSALFPGTNSSISITNVTAANAGVYTVIVTGACGTSTTNSATLVVNADTLVSVPPVDLTNCPGTTANFSVNATGTGLAYQWYAGTNLLSNQTNSTLTLSNVTSASAGIYNVVIAGACGNIITNSAALTVNADLLVATPPSNQTVCPDTTVNFSVNATGTDLTYQWYNSIAALGGQTNSTLTLTNVSAAQAGLYTVIVSGACGGAVTNSAMLTVNSDVLVSIPPVNSTNCPGTTANFSVNATGTALAYQWYQGANLLTGQNANTLTLTNVSAASAGIYSVVITGVCGVAVTNSAVLVVNANTLVTVPPVNSTNCPGTTANFSVNATGTALTYQWYQGANLLTGQTANTLTLTNVSAASAGTYSVVITGACGTTVTNGAVLVVNANTLVTVPPANATNCPGTTANFSVNATGTDLTYAWFKGSALFPGTNSSISITNVTAASAGVYTVVVTGACGTTVTNSATLVVNADTLVSEPPVNSTNCPGTTANLSVNATGTALTYQWYQGTNALTGQTNSILTLSNVNAAEAGTYNVIITGACGTSLTNSAALVVNQNASVAPLPNVTNLLGSSVTFTAVASGTGPLTYQWFQGPDQLIGQTNSMLTLNNLQATNGGPYSVSVTGECGTAAASGFLLTVHLPPVVDITYPTNGQVFVEPAMFNIMASASDPDGIITNVQFFSSTNGVDFVFLGQTNNSPYLTTASNLPAGTYTLIATAADNFGATAQSPPVAIQVVPPQPATVTIIGNLTLNVQDGYQWLSNVVCNPVESYDQAVRVYINNITNSVIQVVNATGTNNGVPYIESPAAIQPGTCWTNVIMFYDPLQLAFYPTLTVELVPPPNAAGNPTGTVVPMLPPKMLANGTFLVEFASVSGGTYYVQYSSDMVNWNTSLPAITGTGQHMQWIDSGPPLTASLPAANVARYYRVILAQ